MFDHFQELRRKLRSIYKLLNKETVISSPIQNGISAFCSELPEYFKDKENSDIYRDHIEKLFQYLENYLKNKPINECLSIINGPLRVLINDVISLKNDLPIWYSVLVLENVLRLYKFENLLPNIFVSMWNDKSSNRQIALVKVIVKHMNISIVQQYIWKTCNSEVLLLFNEVCLKEDKDMAARLFINKFNRLADNIISFFCETIEISPNIVIKNQWIDFSKKRRKLCFLCPRKYLSENDFEDEESDIITITLFSIGHLKLKRDDNQNFAELIVDLNEPCTGILASSTKFLQSYKTINFKVSKDVEEFCSFIVGYFKIKQATTLEDLESDIEYFRTTEIFSEGVSEDNNVVSGTASSPRSSSSDELIVVDTPCIRRNRSSPNISVQETEYDSIETFETQSIYSNSENDPTTRALLSTPKIRNTCVSVAETVASQTSDTNVRRTLSTSSLEISNREEISGIPRNICKTPMLTIRTPEVINSLQELLEIENDDRRIKKRRLTTITNSIASDIEIDNTFAEGSIIELSSQSPKENEHQNVEIIENNQMNKEKQLQSVTNPAIISILPDETIESNCIQTCSQTLNDSPRSCRTQASTKSTPKKKRKRRMSNVSPREEYNDKSFFSSSYKSQGEEIRTRTRVIKKPDFYDSGNEAEPLKKRRKPKKSTAGTLSQLSMHSEPPKKRIKTILPVVRVASSANSTPVTKNILSSTTHSLNIPSNDRHSDQNHGMDLFDRVRYGIADNSPGVIRNLNFSYSQSSPHQDNSLPPRNLNFSTTSQQNINPESPTTIYSSPISPETNKTSRSEKNNNEKKKGPGRQKKTNPETSDFVFTSFSDSSPEMPRAKGKKPTLENKTSGEKKKRGRPKSKAQEKVPKKPGRKRKVEETLNPELILALSHNEVSTEELDRNDKLVENQFNHAKQIIHTALLFPSRNRLKMITQLYNFVRDLKKVVTVKK